MRIDILSTLLVQLCAADLFSKAGNADDISRLQVLREEITACLGHILNLIPCKQEKNEMIQILYACTSLSVQILAATCKCAAICLPHCSQEKVQHTLLTHCNVGGVGKVYKSSNHLRGDVTQCDLWGATLFEAAGEHGPEVGAAGCQDYLVHLDK